MIEYSEIDPTTAARVDAAGKLVFGAGNIANHLFSRAFIEKAAAASPATLPYHLAKKKIPVADASGARGAAPAANNGLKLEAFIFDAFTLAETQCVLEVRRADEFAPVKNAPGAATDSPDTARAQVLALGAEWARAAGANVTGKHGVEVSPLVSYGGEGPELEDLLRGGVRVDASAGPVLIAPAKSAGGAARLVPS